MFIGIKALNTAQQNNDMNELCYEKVLNFVRKGHQVMVFVHARNATSKTAMALLGMVSDKKSINTIFGLKHFKQNFIKNCDIFL